MDPRHVQLSDSLEGIARVGVVFLKHVAGGPVSLPLRKQMDDLANELRRSLEGRKLSELESVARIRKLYHSLGVDPTKDRPSSERLLRRVVHGKELPRVNRLVDTVNYASLRLQCPLGVYDWDRIVPPVLVRIGRPQERFVKFSRSTGTDSAVHQDINLHGRIVLVDGEGLFGNPSHDSERTLVTPGTVRALVVAWAPADAPRSFLESVIKEVSELCEEYCDSKMASSAIL